jgi:capsule polysaccharide export protein KpsC/LpsZ
MTNAPIVKVAMRPKSGKVANAVGDRAVLHKHGNNNNQVPIGLSARANRAYGTIHDGRYRSTHVGVAVAVAVTVAVDDVGIDCDNKNVEEGDDGFDMVSVVSVDDEVVVVDVSFGRGR